MAFSDGSWIAMIPIFHRPRAGMQINTNEKARTNGRLDRRVELGVMLERLGLRGEKATESRRLPRLLNERDAPGPIDQSTCFGAQHFSALGELLFHDVNFANPLHSII